MKIVVVDIVVCGMDTVVHQGEKQYLNVVSVVDSCQRVLVVVDIVEHLMHDKDLKEEIKMTLKEDFRKRMDTIENPRLLVTALHLHTGAIEVITNTQYLFSKLSYIDIAYDEDFKLKTNPSIQIVAFILI